MLKKILSRITLVSLVSFGTTSIAKAETYIDQPRIGGNRVSPCVRIVSMGDSDKTCDNRFRQIAANRFCQEKGFNQAIGFNTNKRRRLKRVGVYRLTVQQGSDSFVPVSWEYASGKRTVFKNITCN